uniref:Uncharacterized protein n=1 Tax=Sarcophilus harrisii TaxID=9305 RepID=A0A7N4NV61_SARHA
MASLYQRFTGKINTSRSFPIPPEASHLLGGQGTEEESSGAGGKSPRPPVPSAPQDHGAGGRPRFQYQPRNDCEEEDVRLSFFVGDCGCVGGGGGKRRRSDIIFFLIFFFFFFFVFFFFFSFFFLCEEGKSSPDNTSNVLVPLVSAKPVTTLPMFAA